jgi:hypothetical protein
MVLWYYNKGLWLMCYKAAYSGECIPVLMGH